jgi:hypothetical protein
MSKQDIPDGKVISLLVAIVALASAAKDWIANELYKTLASVPKLGPRFETVAQARMGNKGQLGLGTIIAALIVVIAAFLAIIVVDEMNSSLDSPSDPALQNSTDAVLDGFSSMMELIAPLFLVAISVVIIGLVQRLRG